MAELVTAMRMPMIVAGVETAPIVRVPVVTAMPITAMTTPITVFVFVEAVRRFDQRIGGCGAEQQIGAWVGLEVSVGAQRSRKAQAEAGGDKPGTGAFLQGHRFSL